jgi:hypothetical protein
MPRTTLAERLAAALLRWRLNSRVRRRKPRRRPLPIDNRRPEMNLSFLSGYKTYVIAVAMVVIGISQMLGVDLPSFEGQAAGQLIMEGFAILFLRKGIKAAG